MIREARQQDQVCDLRQVPPSARLPHCPRARQEHYGPAVVDGGVSGGGSPQEPVVVGGLHACAPRSAAHDGPVSPVGIVAAPAADGAGSVRRRAKANGSTRGCCHRDTAQAPRDPARPNAAAAPTAPPPYRRLRPRYRGERPTPHRARRSPYHGCYGPAPGAVPFAPGGSCCGRTLIHRRTR